MEESRLIYSPNCYTVYENLDELLESLSSLNLDSTDKTIIWQVFSLSVISDISWKESVIRIRESIEHAIIVLKQYSICRKSIVPASFKYTQKELEAEYDKLEITNSNHGHSKLLIPLLSLKGFRIIGIFYYDDISCIPTNIPLLHTHTFMIEYKRIKEFTRYNIAENVMDLETRRITLYLDSTSTSSKPIIMQAKAFFAAIKPYIKLLSLEVKSKVSIGWKSSSRSSLLLKASDLFDDHTYN
jgi:hypothetical protein